MGTRGRQFALAALVVAGVAAAVALGSVAGAATTDDANGHAASPPPEEITECTVLDEPGRYEVVADLETDEGTCLHVNASDVSVDGNGHAIAGTGPDAAYGVLAFNGSSDARDRAGEELRNVTVEDLSITGFRHGVLIGEPLDDGPTVTLAGIGTEGNGNGVAIYGSEGSTVRNLTAADNDGSGLLLWEVTRLSARNLTLVDNDGDGLFLSDGVTNSTFEDVTASNNTETGAYFGTGVGRNVLEGSRIEHNGRAGVRFGDSFDNTVRDALIVDNDGPGVLADPGGGDLVVDATVAGNAIAYRSQSALPFGGIEAEQFRLASGTVARFNTSVIALDDAGNETAVPETPEGTRVVGPATNLTVSENDRARPEATLTVPYAELDVEENEDVALWYYTDGEWQRLSSTTDRTAGTVTATVRETGVVVPLARDPGTGVVGDGSDLVINSTGNGEEFGYGVVVDGTIEKTHASNVSADAEEHVERRGDGTYVALGSTGDGVGDAFRIDGEIISFDTFPDDSDYSVELDGRNVTENLTA